MQKSHQRWFDTTAFLLLATAALIASARLSLTEWIPDLQVIANLARLGLFLGLVLGYSQFKKVGVIILTLGYSLVIVTQQIVSVVSPLLPNEERVYEMSARVLQALVTVRAQAPVEDPLTVLILLGLLFWIISIYAGFSLVRQQHGLAALLPSTLTILAIQYSDNSLDSPLWMLGFYFFFAFLLLARLDYLAKQESWKKKNFFIIPDAKFDLGILSSLAMAVLLLFTWNLPSSDAEFQNISRWWDKTTYRFESTRKNLDNLFSSIDNPRQARGTVLYGRSLALGERSYQGTNAIAIVQVLEVENAPPRYYWRVRSYDTYINGAWTSAEGSITESLSAQTPLLLPIDPESETAKFTFINKAELTPNLLTPHQSYWVDIDTFATYTSIPDGTLDLNLLRATENLRIDDSYSVRAAPLAPTIAELRAAGTEYPDWVTARYLQLPDNLPESITELAETLTSRRGPTYDKVRVITTYLRTEIEYSDTVPAPPAGRDPLDWFLFTWKEGYCNYAASAEVVMLRSVGIPARLVVGFAQGQKVEEGNYSIIQKDAHAWPEVYFPEIGWVEFEPTGNQTRLIRPIGELPPEDELNGVLRNGLLEDEALLEETPAPAPEPEGIELPEDVIDEEQKSKRDRPRMLFWGIIVLVTVAAFFGIRQLNRKQAFLTSGLRRVIRLYENRDSVAPAWLVRWLAWLEASPIERAFHSINRSLRWLDVDIPLHLTARERTDALQEILLEEREALITLLNEHEKNLFTSVDGDIKAAQRASLQISRAALKRKMQKR